MESTINMTLGEYLVHLASKGISISMWKPKDMPYQLRLRAEWEGKMYFQAISFSEFSKSILSTEDLLKLHIEQMVKEF